MLRAALLSVATVLSSLSPLALAERFPAEPHVYVTGEAIEKRPPDFAVTSFAINRIGADVAATKRSVDEITEQVWQAAQEVGIARADFEATGFSINPIHEFRDGQRVYQGTQVSRQFTARLRDMDRFNEWSERLVKAGVQDVPGVSVDIDQREDREAALRIKALQNARAEADRLADALGHSVTGLHTISDTPIGDGGGIPFKTMQMSRAAEQAPTLPDHVELRVEAYAVFLIRPK